MRRFPATCWRTARRIPKRAKRWTAGILLRQPVRVGTQLLPARPEIPQLPGLRDRRQDHRRCRGAGGDRAAADDRTGERSRHAAAGRAGGQRLLEPAAVGQRFGDVAGAGRFQPPLLHQSRLLRHLARQHRLSERRHRKSRPVAPAAARCAGQTGQGVRAGAAFFPARIPVFRDQDRIHDPRYAALPRTVGAPPPLQPPRHRQTGAVVGDGVQHLPASFR